MCGGTRSRKHKCVVLSQGMDDEIPDELLIEEEQVEEIVKAVADKVIGPDTAFNPNKIQLWTANLVENILKQLCAINKPFKFVVTTNFLQRNGAGLHTACSCFWDSKLDGKIAVLYENSTMSIIVTVYWLNI